MSVDCMQISNFGTRHHCGGVCRPIAKRFSIDWAVDHYQTPIVYFDQFGLCASVTMSSLGLISSFLQAADSRAQKGGI
jgi:hypothetical protein